MKNKNPNILTMKRKETFAGYFFISPALLFYSIFFIFPVTFSFLISFKRWNMLRPLSSSPWIGFRNYIYLFTRDDLFKASLINSVIYAFVTVFLTLSIALLIAVVLLNIKYAVVWRFIFFAPIVTPQVALGIVWGYLYDPNRGLLNSILSFFGIPTHHWLTDPSLALFSVMITAVWAGIGGPLLIFTASLKGIPDLYYDAAKIDGANAIKRFWYITLPLLRPTLLFTIITGLLGAWQVFDLIYIMTRNAPAESVWVVSLYMYQIAFQSLRMGRASAAAFILFLIVLVITLIVLRIFKKGGIEGYE
ncbi:MAG: sugar ABC transporter permease [Thermotoga sp.]|nr:MAG: sugar ABC transporter permease [Thermotoga sp.]